MSTKAFDELVVQPRGRNACHPRGAQLQISGGARKMAQGQKSPLIAAPTALRRITRPAAQLSLCVPVSVALDLRHLHCRRDPTTSLHDHRDVSHSWDTTLHLLRFLLLLFQNRCPRQLPRTWAHHPPYLPHLVSSSSFSNRSLPSLRLLHVKLDAEADEF